MLWRRVPRSRAKRAGLLGPLLTVRGTIFLAGCLVTTTIALFAFGYRATQQWERSTREAAESRAKNLLAVVAGALERDMKGAQGRLLLPFTSAILERSLPYDLANRFTGGFARYPYLDSVFVWSDQGSPAGSAYFFTRADPPVGIQPRLASLHPVQLRRNPLPMRELVSAVREQATAGPQFAAFTSTIGGVHYQTVVHLLHSAGPAPPRRAAIGFTVQLDSARTHYFSDFVREIHKITAEPSLGIEILDNEGRQVAATGPPTIGATFSRRFPLLFADPSVVSSHLPQLRPADWTIRVGAGSDAALAAAGRGTGRTIALLTIAAVVAIVALILTVRAGRAAAELATLQSEFVSAVSHEMKTPLSIISLASDTLARGRYNSSETIREYGGLLAKEAQQLTRLIENVLCYARLHASAGPSGFEAVDLVDVVEDSVERFGLKLDALNFDVQLQMPIDVPAVQADRIMLQHALDNVIDNAVKHGEAGGRLQVTVRVDASWVHIEVADEGQGIPADEVPHIFNKFYRGKGARQRGSGLGLAIVERIVREHSGRLDIKTAVGKGTTVAISLPLPEGRSSGTAA
jgi:signal transduction histidine kinase